MMGTYIINIIQKFLGRDTLAGILILLAAALATSPAMAQDVVSDIAINIVDSGSHLPALVSASAYLIGLALGVLGVMKIRDHVENPSNAPLRSGFARLFIGGALLALPTVYTAMIDSIDGGPGAALYDFMNFLGFGKTTVADSGGENFNKLLGNLLDSIGGLPALVSMAAYLFALVFGVTGLLGLRAHVESPDQNPLKDAVIKLIVGGMLFALPYVFSAMASTISNGFGFYTTLDGFGIKTSSIDGGKACATGDAKLSGLICNVIGNTALLPLFLDGISYLFGIIMGFWGIIKIRDHVINPSQTRISEGITRLAAGGMFFTMPYVVSVVRESVVQSTASAATNTGFSGSATCESGSLQGLDQYLFCAVSDVLGPIQNIVNYAAMLAGIIFIMIGISRLLKSEQDGPRGPGGMGTIMTFLTGGILLSFSEFIQVITGTLLAGGATKSKSALQYTTGMTTDEIAHADMVVGAIMKFMIIVGLISLVQGIFIIRKVAEGDSQSSVMAGMTHIIGGALAVNLGPFLNAVQKTLGITTFGIVFS
jgi:hypothetical protein